MAKDAAEITPKMIPDEALLPRDNSGGIDWDPHTGQWDDGGFVMGGAKSYLSASGGKEAKSMDGERKNPNTIPKGSRI